MCKPEQTAYFEGAEQEELNPYPLFSDAYWMFEKGRRDAAGLEF
jgi:hypothetical protein